MIRGSGGNDTIFTGSGTHTTYARAGNDRVVAGTGANRIFAGPGNDLIEARNGFRDYVGCGSGHDIAIGDDIDVIRSCSVVIRHPTGSLRFPVRVGSPHDLGDGWRVKVVSVTPYANEVVLKADKSNRPPPAGKQYFLVKISASLRGKQSRYLRATQRFRAVTHSKATVYSSFEDSCGILPALDLETYDREVLPGRRLVGNVCWTVKSSDAKKLVMFAAPLVTGERVFFALH